MLDLCLTRKQLYIYKVNASLKMIAFFGALLIAQTLCIIY